MTLNPFRYIRRRLGRAIRWQVATEVEYERQIVNALREDLRRMSVEYTSRIRVLENRVDELSRSRSGTEA